MSHGGRYLGRMRRFILLVIVLLGGSAAVAVGQAAAERALGQVKVGSRLKVGLPGAAWIGTYQSFGAGDLVLARDSLTKHLRLDAITGLWVPGRATKAGAIVGAVAGAVAGGFLGLVVAGVCDANCPSQATGMLVGGGLGAVSGLGLGAIVGAAIPKWRRIY